MRILQIIASLNSAQGGPAETVRQFSTLLSARGHAVEVLSLDAPGSSGLAIPGVPVHALGPGIGRYGYTSRLRPWLRREASRFDAVIVRGIWQYHGYASRLELPRQQVPYFVYPHGMLDPWFARRYPLKHLKKLTYWGMVERSNLRLAEKVLFTSAEEQRLAPSAFPCSSYEGLVVSYGTAAPAADSGSMQQDFFKAYPQLGDKRYLLFLGRIHEKKGIDLLLEAFGRVAVEAPDLHLAIAGPDEQGLTDALVQKLERSGLSERVHWLGMIGGSIKWGALYGADAFILPSHQENFGIAVVEALACGKPVLISNQVNIWREIQDAGVGLVAADDLAGTESLMRQWLSMPVGQQQRMRTAAPELFKARFEVNAAVDSLLKVLAEVRKA